MRSTLVAVTALLPAVVVAGSAIGAGPTPTSDASGPLPYAVYQSKRSTSALQMFVAPNGRRVRFATLSYRATCVRGSRRTRRTMSDDLGGIVIERGRRFIRRERFRAGGQSGRRVLSGRFTSTWSLARVRYETRFRARDRAACHAIVRFHPRRLDSTAPTIVTAPAVSPPVAQSPAPAQPAPSPPAAPTPAPTPVNTPGTDAGNYTGTTAAGDPIAFTLGAVNSPLPAIDVAATLACDDGTVRRAELQVAPAPDGRLRNNGRFDASGTVGDLRFTLEGNADGGSASGRVELRTDSSGGGDGEDVPDCRGARLSFTATRG